VITGTGGGNLANALLQADAALKESYSQQYTVDDHKSREAILTELAIASGKGDVRILVGSCAKSAVDKSVTD